jgi:hypothetical protein
MLHGRLPAVVAHVPAPATPAPDLDAERPSVWRGFELELRQRMWFTNNYRSLRFNVP